MITFMKTSTWVKLQNEIHKLRVELDKAESSNVYLTYELNSALGQLNLRSSEFEKVKELAQLMNKLDIKKLIINQEKGTTMLERNFKDSKK